MKYLLCLISSAMLASCSGAATVNNSAWVKPIYVSKDDRCTTGTNDQILVHNETWKKQKQSN